MKKSSLKGGNMVHSKHDRLVCPKCGEKERIHCSLVEMKKTGLETSAKYCLHCYACGYEETQTVFSSWVTTITPSNLKCPFCHKARVSHKTPSLEGVVKIGMPLIRF